MSKAAIILIFLRTRSLILNCLEDNIETEAMIGVKILKGWAACLLKIISPRPKQYLSQFKRYYQNTLLCLDFCISLLEFNIYNKP